jgi:cell division protein FtsI (penicillin-binding protein 3)
MTLHGPENGQAGTPRRAPVRNSRTTPGPGRDALRAQQAPRARQASGPRPVAIRPGGRVAGGTRGPGSTRVPGTGDPRRRQALLAVAVLVLLAVFAARLVYIQGFRGEAVAQEALAKRLSTASLLAARGQITDASGVQLATSVERYTVTVDQKALATWKVRGSDPLVAGPSGAAGLLAPILGLNAAELGAKLAGESRYKIVAKGVLPEQWRAIRELGIDGILAEQTSERVYPNKTLAGNLLGWVNSQGVGATGLEALLDKKLQGTPGTVVYEHGRGGQEIPGGYQQQTGSLQGSSVQLTILGDLQWKAEEAINSQVAATGSDSGVIVAIDTRTGEILALADSGAVDPNSPKNGKLSGSSAISDVFEPGSTAKVITMAAALETGLANPLTQFEVPYAYTTPNNQTFHDSHDHATLKLTMTGILSESSNAGTVMLGQNIPQQVRYDYLEKFGFGAPTGIELPDESAGILHPSAEWDGRSKYAVLFGQSVSVTALQATEVYATIANHGVRVQPHLIKGWTAPDGAFTPTTAAASTQVIAPATADTVMTMLESVVDGGTGSSAAIPGYRVAGKTGTAQKFNPDGITASFIGVVPADDPHIAVSVILQNPKSSIYGGDVAAPVFSDVAGYALQELGIAPSGKTAQLFATTWQ